MQSQNVSSSSISDASEIRYQKAVRQISKLIGMNNSLKRDNDNFRAITQTLQIQNKQLFQRYEQFGNQRRNYEMLIKKLQNQINQLQKRYQNVRNQQNQLIMAKVLEQRNKQSQALNILNEKLNQQGHTIIQLEQNIAQLQKQNKNLKASNDKLEAQLKQDAKLKQQKTKSQTNQQFKFQQLSNQLRNQVQYRHAIEKQLIQIKKKQHPYFNQQISMQYRHEKGNFLVKALEEKVRMVQQKYRKKDILVYKLTDKIQKLEKEVSKFKQRQKLFQTTTMQIDSLQKK